MNEQEFYAKYANWMYHYNSLLGDVYAQPEDEGHRIMAVDILTKWLPLLTSVNSVLDVGCGEGYLQEVFESFGMEYTGVTLGQDYIVATGNDRNVINMDFNFLEFPDNAFDMVFSRHSLEHSPFPLLTLMEWGRVAKDFLMVIVPTPAVWGYGGKNHYSVMDMEQLKFVLQRAGFRVIWMDQSDEREYRVMCEKIRIMGK